MPPPEQTGDSYQLQGEIARGGMGAVLRGRDVDLGRDLAVKVLPEKHARRPEVARRFIEEAQIGGRPCGRGSGGSAGLGKIFEAINLSRLPSKDSVVAATNFLSIQYPCRSASLSAHSGIGT